MVMRVFVAGGTGVVGRRLVPQLVAREPLGDDYDDERGQAELAWRGWARRAS
jgi:nucleoside-diphosphate-sugar epimerase